MSDKNIVSQTFNTGESSNFEALALNVQKYAPKNVNITSTTGAVSGDVVFEFSTPKDTFLDLYKTYMSADILENETINDTVLANDKLLLPCMFQRGVVIINGTRVATSNNYTQDGYLSRRIQFGKSYNQSVNSMFNPAWDVVTAGYVVPATDATKKYVSRDTLDSFWIRQEEGLIVPPNSNIRFEFSFDQNWRAKNVFTGTGALQNTAGMGARIQALWMHPCFYVAPEEVKSSYRFRFIGVNSFAYTMPATTTAGTLNLQYTVSPKVVKMALTMQAANYNVIAANKRTAAFMFDNSAGIQTLQFKHGNLVFPQSMYNFSYGLDDAYEDYVNHSQQILKDSGKEDIDVYSNSKLNVSTLTTTTYLNNWGPVFLAPIVKDITDPTNTMEVNATFTGVANNTYVFLSSLEEQAVEFSQEDGAISTIFV